MVFLFIDENHLKGKLTIVRCAKFSNESIGLISADYYRLLPPPHRPVFANYCTVYSMYSITKWLDCLLELLPQGLAVAPVHEGLLVAHGPRPFILHHSNLHHLERTGATDQSDATVAYSEFMTFPTFVQTHIWKYIYGIPFADVFAQGQPVLV